MVIRRRGYGLGGGGRDIVNTDEQEEHAPDVGGQAVSFPAMRDYDVSDTLYVDGPNHQMPLHEGSKVFTLGELVDEGADDWLTPDEVDAYREHEAASSFPKPPQDQLRATVVRYGGGLLEIPGSDYRYLHGTNPESQTVMYDPKQDWYFVDVPARYRTAQRQPWVAVDLDGTILEEAPEGDKGQQTFGALKPGAAEALAELTSLGWRVSIYTARFGDEDLDEATIARWAEEIGDYLRSNEVPFNDVWVGRKPRADVFVDDKAIRFEDDWPAIVQQVAVIPTPHRAGRGPLDESGDPNGFDDPLGLGQADGVDRPPGDEGALFG